MRMVSEQNIAKISFIYTIIVVSVMTFGAGVLFVVKKHETAAKDLASFEQELLEQQKIQLRTDVNGLVAWIDTSLETELQKHINDPETSTGGISGISGAPAKLDELAKSAVTNLLRHNPGLNEDSLFIYELHNPEGGKDFATMLFNPSRPDLVGDTLSDDFLDAQGRPFRKEFMKGIRTDGESSIIYWYPKQNSSDDSEVGRKLSYFKLYPQFNWIVAKNIVLDHFDQSFVDRKSELKNRMRNDIIFLCLLFVSGMVLALLFAYSFSKQIQPIFETYRQNEQKSEAKLGAINKQFAQQSQTDTLTSAFNRSHFSLELAKETVRSDRYRTPLSMIIFDIDRLEKLNSDLGNLAGDTVLQEVVNLVQDNIRRTDILARWGGGEFVILAPGVDLEHGFKFAEKLRILIEQNNFSIDQNLTCSFGISDYTPTEEIEKFIKRADTALAQAKAQGRNSCISMQA